MRPGLNTERLGDGFGQWVDQHPAIKEHAIGLISSAHASLFEKLAPFGLGDVVEAVGDIVARKQVPELMERLTSAGPQSSRPWLRTRSHRSVG